MLIGILQRVLQIVTLSRERADPLGVRRSIRCQLSAARAQGFRQRISLRLKRTDLRLGQFRLYQRFLLLLGRLI